VKDREQDNSVPESVKAWFAESGFTLAISRVDGIMWADLVNTHGEVVAPGYGRGANATEAADRAKRRYLEEQ
jgi:microcystin degradation protein MlrC